MPRKLNAFPAGSGSLGDTGMPPAGRVLPKACCRQCPLVRASGPYRGAGSACGDAGDDGLLKAFGQVLERPTETTALVLWRSAARCHYGEQLWICGVATQTGSCAVSGRAVKRGDRIYRPRRGRVRMSNALAVILASLIETDARGGG